MRTRVCSHVRVQEEDTYVRAWACARGRAWVGVRAWVGGGGRGGASPPRGSWGGREERGGGERRGRGGKTGDIRGEGEGSEGKNGGKREVSFSQASLANVERGAILELSPADSEAELQVFDEAWEQGVDE